MFAAIRDGRIDQFSVGFLTAPGADTYKNGVREISDILQLVEISGVLMAASPGTAVLSTKANSYDEPLAGLGITAAQAEEHLTQLVQQQLDNRANGIPRPDTSQPFREELEKPYHLRGWDWNEYEHRWVRRQVHDPQAVKPLEPGVDPYSIEEATKRWARSGLGGIPWTPSHPEFAPSPAPSPKK